MPIVQEHSLSWWEKPGQWELGAGGQIASTVGKQSEMTPGAQLTVCFLFSPGLHPMEWCHPHLQ